MHDASCIQSAIATSGPNCDKPDGKRANHSMLTRMPPIVESFGEWLFGFLLVCVILVIAFIARAFLGAWEDKSRARAAARPEIKKAAAQREACEDWERQQREPKLSTLSTLAQTPCAKCGKKFWQPARHFEDWSGGLCKRTIAHHLLDHKECEDCREGDADLTPEPQQDAPAAPQRPR